MSGLPIGDYALLSDCHAAALVSKGGSIDWLCVPRFDSPSVYGRLLDPRAGHFAIRPRGDFRTTRRYLPDTLVLETTFETDAGTAVLTDALAVGRNERGHELGAGAPRLLLRRVACTRGTVDLEVELAARPEYGVDSPLLFQDARGVETRGGPNCLALSAPMPLAIAEATARASFTLAAGQAAAFACHHRISPEIAPGYHTQDEITARIEDTAEAWRTFSSLHQNYQGVWRDRVHHSGLVLRGLTYFPTGAMCAAVTTSLPESQGGGRNWDYRFTWVRDASYTLEALWVAACPDEAHQFFDFLASVAVSSLASQGDLQIMFGIGGERDLTERELWHLAGWRNNRPVRVGNAAWRQRQVDVYGELLLAVERMRDHMSALRRETREFLVEVAETAALRWRSPDQGIWEMRDEPRHFVHSKVMCWVALDRAILLAGLLGAERRVPRWTAVRDEIRASVLDRGFSRRLGAFRQCFDADNLDASSLVLPMVGFLRADDPRMLATLDAVTARLTDRHGLVYRYRSDDGLAGDEGTFLLCTFWLAQVQALAGRVGAARDTWSRAASFANDVGLMAEEVDPRTRELLGNFPQAFSHIGLVNAAWAIEECAAGREPRPPSTCGFSP